MASQIWEIVEKWDATVVMFLNWLCNIFDFVIDFSPASLPDGVKSKDRLRLRKGVIGSNQLDDGVDDGVSGIGAPSIRLSHLFKMFLVACSFMAFKHYSTSSHCCVAFFEPSTFEVPNLSSFKMSCN
jgi:hypothetical protein